jgi:GAF domain-containing protein
MTSQEIFAALSAFRRSLAAEGGGADAPWTALRALAQDIVGAKLFTVMKIDLDANVSRRLYTNMPEAYPASGTKPISVTPWFEQVVLGKQMFVMNTIEEISQHFFDHELIASLGCGSCVNMPVVVKGRVLGTVNMLDAEHHFTPERVALVEHLQIPAMAAFQA